MWSYGLYRAGSGLGQVQALVNVVMNLQVHKMHGISRLAESGLASQEGLCSME